MSELDDDDERDPTESEEFKTAEEYGSAAVPKTFPRTLVIAVSTHGTIRTFQEKFKVPEGITLVKVNAVIPSVCNIVAPQDMKDANELITKKVNERRHLDSTDLVSLSSKITYEIIKKVTGSKNETDSFVKEQRKAGEVEEIKVELAFLDSFARGYSVQNIEPGSTMINKVYLRKNSEARNKEGDWQIKALNIAGQPDLINEVENANGERSTRYKEAEITFEQLINFCMDKGSRRFLIFDFSCANVTDEFGNDAFDGDERCRRSFARETLKEGKNWGGKTKRRRRRNKKSKKRSRKITRRKRNRK